MAHRLACDCAERIGTSVHSWEQFHSLREFFFSQVKKGIFEEIKPILPYEVWADEWFKCLSCGALWEHVFPDPPGNGRLTKFADGVHREAEGGELRIYNYYETINERAPQAMFQIGEIREDNTPEKIDIQGFHSFQELFTFSREHRAKFIGTPFEGNRFEVIVFDKEQHLLGIAYYDNGRGLQITFINDEKFLFVAFENKFIVLRRIYKEMITEEQLSSPIIECLLMSEGEVLVVCERGVCLVGAQGEIKWQQELDEKLIDFEIVDARTIDIKGSNGGSFSFCIFSGTQIMKR